MKKYLLYITIFYGNFAFAQLNEAFNDDEFTSNPIWNGSNSTNDFSVVTKQLRSNPTNAADYYLSTPNTLAANCQWEFWVNLQFNPSNANYVDIYLISNQANLLSTNINGYFVRLGNTEDEISLYKRSGTTTSSVKLINGTDGILDKTNNKVKIRITRKADNTFTLEYDVTGAGTAYVSEPSVQDAAYTTSAYFGIFIKQSSAASVVQKHFFDDFKISALVTDAIPPKLSSVVVKDESTLEVTFDEPIDSISAKNIFNYNINNNVGNPALVTTTTDPSKYILKLSAGLNTATYLITTSNIKDNAGNIITANNTAPFSYVKPYVANKGDLVINEIFADPSPQIDLPSVEFIEIYNTSNQTILLNNWKYADQTSTSSFPIDSIKAKEYLILCAKADTNEFKSFGKTIGISPWPSLNNTSDILKLISPQNKTIDSVAYSDSWYPTLKKQGGWTLERIDYKSVCTGLFNWTASSDNTGGTPGKQNSVLINNFDQVAFKADSMQQLSDSTLVVYLNKPADVTSISSTFNLNPGSGIIKSKTFTPNAKQVTLLFSYPFTANTSYQLSISQLKDCAQNPVIANSFQFKTPPLPPIPAVRLDTAKIYITEILADPSPEIQLPLTEFIEIYNPGKDTIDLDGWFLYNSKTRGTLKKGQILPNQYLILCSSADTLTYKSFGKVLGVSPWPTLTNSSDKIILKSFKDRLVDSVLYSDTWHSSTIKKQGGWTLERIDYKSVCGGLFNWTSSNNSSGGTPGHVNSVKISHYDQLAFKADSAKKLSDTTISMYFNKPVDFTTINNTFNLSPASGNISVGFDTYSRQAVVHFGNAFAPNTTYQLNVSQLKDCAGNSIQPFNFQFTTPSLPPLRLDTASIFITEIFADPSPEINLPLAEFIEIYNPGRDTIDLEGWTIGNSKTKVSLKKAFISPNDYLILCSSTDTLQYNLLGKTLGISTWPSLTNTSDQVVLKSFKNRLSDSISYYDTWHSSTIKKQGGWSLERIDCRSFCKGVFNWTSSINSSGGTPGKINSVNISGYDLLAFKADSISQVSDTTIYVYFNKHVDVSASVNSFNLHPSSGTIKSISFDSQSTKAALVMSNKFEANTTYQLDIKQLKDCAGNSISPSSFTFKTPRLATLRPDTAKLYITEIFADPSPEINLPLAEFIEIYNPGKDTIDLDGWTLHSSKTKSLIKKALILPNTYLILCPLADTLAYKSFGKVSGLSAWPALTNSSDEIVLKSFKGRLVDSIAYSDTWHSSSTKKQGGWSLERIDYQSLCSGKFNWTSSTHISGGTPGKQNSVQITNYDRVNFKVDSIKQLSDTSLAAYFNKSADVSKASTIFDLRPNSGSVTSVTPDFQAKKVVLAYSNKFEPNTVYSLSVNKIKDCAGNIIVPNNALTFTTPKLSAIRLDTAQIYITEIFADPSPEVKLPLVEFIEIYNPGKDTIDLDGWTLNNSKNKGSIKKASIAPNAYLILCPASDTLQYKSFGNVTGLSSWPSLVNTTDQILLKSFKNRLTDSIIYSDTWHSSSTKKQGGWSLERIDHRSICSGKFNWVSSINTNGGTPGEQNSVYHKDYDRLTFRADSIQQSDSLINVFFNKPADISSLANAFTVTPGSIKSASFNSQATKATLICDKFKANATYQITVSKLKDCAGNEIFPNSALTFTTPKSPPLRLDTAKLYLTEIFADPSPEIKLPLVEFVEIFNPGKDTILLDGWTLNTATSKGTFKTSKISPREYLIISPATDTSLYKSYGKTIGISPWPSLTNTAGQIILKSFKGRTVDSISYKDSWYKNELKKSGGWSLELIDRQSVCNVSQNWIASNDASGGTPGRQNSVHQLFNSADPLKIVNATLVDSLTILLSFNRPPDSLSASIIDNYVVNNGVGKPQNVLVNPDALNLVKLKLAKSITRGSTYRIELSNITDCIGKSINSTNNFAEFFYPEKISKNDILITEILFNPRVGGADFVEVYNNSGHELDLKELSIANIKAPDSIVSRKMITANTLILKPKQYLVLTTDPDNVKKEYHTENPDAFLKMLSMPAFNNDAGSVVLLSADNRIDQLNYFEKMHFALIKDSKGVSLERSDNKRPANESGNFRSAAASVGYATPGYKNSQSIDDSSIELNEVALLSKTFSPDNDGFEDALQISYNFKDAGMVANATIYNDKGILIKRLAKNITLAANGTLVWDGMNDNEQIAPVGIYIIYVEAFNLSGDLKKYRKAFVLAAKFN